MTWAIGAVLLLAALGKAYNPIRAGLFAQYVVTGSPGGHGAWYVFAAGLAAVEAWLGLRLFLAPRSRRVLAVTLILLVLFSIALIRAALEPGSPACGCLGVVGFQAEDDAAAGLLRNGAMIWITGWLLLQPLPVGHAGARGAVGRSRGSRRSAFTLIELLMVIAIVASLIAIILPALAGARDRARTVTVLSTLRQLHASLAMYAADHTDHLPYFATPGQPQKPITVGSVSAPGGYFGAQARHWTQLVAPAYFDQAPDAMALTGVRRSGSPSGEELKTSRYWLTQTAFARPSYWEPSGELRDADLRGMRMADVAFPAGKGLLLDVKAGVFAEQGANANIGFGDGSADGLNWDKLMEGDLYVGQRPYGGIGWAVLATRSGFAGVDR